jgi:hypothetical protein
MKAKTRKTSRKITVEYRYSIFDRNRFVTANDQRLIGDNNRTITLDKYSGMLTVSEKDRFTKEKKRFLTPEQLQEIIIFVHTRKRNILNDKKTATVQIFDKTSSNSPVLLLLKEPYKEAFALAAEFSELLGLNMRELPGAVN